MTIWDRHIKKEKRNISIIDIINFIMKKDPIYSSNKNKDKRDFKILDEIDFEKIDDEFINEFKDFNIEMIFKKDIIKYSTNLFNKVKNWKTFCNIYHIINDENLKKDLLKNLSDLVNLIDNKYRAIKENKNDLNNLQDEKLKIFIETLEELCKGIEEKKIQIKQIKSLFDCNEENIKEKFKLFSLIKERNIIMK